MTRQLELLAVEKVKRDTAIESVLRDSCDWMTALDLCNEFGIRPMFNSLDSAKREVRLWASASDRVISGQKGYKHIANATEAEMDHFCGWMHSQAMAMLRRKVAVESEFKRCR